jgi:hypothetical protein
VTKRYGSVPVEATLKDSLPALRRLGALAVAACALCCLILVAGGATASTARAATLGPTDVMFLYDTSGSMSPILEEAESEIAEVLQAPKTSVPKHSSGAGTLRSRRCRSYKVVQRAYGHTSTTHLYGLRAYGVSCRKMRSIIHRYIFGPNRPAGPLPADGVLVGKWSIIIRMGAVFGKDGRRHIHGKYSVR